mgnify:CR=1 FL=1
MKTILAIFLVMIIAIIAIFYSIKYENEHGIISKAKTHEQGLWDGYNITVKYLKHKGILNDTIQFSVVEIDSVLHSK